ncbi:MAG TPA: Na+/H+ antiporter subunit E [Candidatus Corynebacterium avicola]|uniref:Na+/H+ antiporter subunit E n=1 Tax=Candidatus Corynebacterium avicola TaxID=2838527 RepID=A0A9D1RPB8_9CORY|nr:Na+/H+ antiporter subunit E [Candidatus Corynebacterium avicola]
MKLTYALRSSWHVVSYGVWLIGQVIKESLIMASDTFTTGRHIAPVMVYYPLRLTRERDIAAFIASITITPGTLALGVTGPKEVDEDAAAGKRNLQDAADVATSEFRTHGLTRVQRFLAVHAMYGADPQELLHSLAHMEAKLVPSVRKKKIEFDVEHLVERGVPGPRGYRGNRGGRASEDGTFDIEKVDSTPHAAAFVAAIMRQEDALDENDLGDLSREQREKIAREHARKAAEERRRRAQEEEERRRRKLAEELSPPPLTLEYEDEEDDDSTGIDPARVAPETDGGVAALAHDTDSDASAPATGSSSSKSSSGRRTAPITSLVNALEVRSRLPHPNLNLSGTGKQGGKSDKTGKSEKAGKAEKSDKPKKDTDTTEDGKK